YLSSVVFQIILSVSDIYRGLFSESMKKMFLKLVLFCLCLWRLDGVFGYEVSMIEGHSVTLNSDLTEMKDDDVIQWRFGDENTVIADINKRADRITVYDDVLDGRFRDRLKLDNQTGSLTITNTTTEHAGLYKLQINSEIKRFSLTVIVSVSDGGRFSLSKL
ncbi:hypothetical protein PO909_027647, partial [Leuciscus waleckii]